MNAVSKTRSGTNIDMLHGFRNGFWGFEKPSLFMITITCRSVYVLDFPRVFMRPDFDVGKA